MYSGNNPSALRSMEWLRNALLQLLKEKQYSQITIKEICKRADLSRQTFYQMFDSKDEVMQYHFSILFQEFTKECDSFQNITVLQIAYHFFQFFYNHRDFIEIIISNNLTFLLEQQFEVYLRKIDLFCMINDHELYPDYTTAYIAGALTQSLIHWFEQSFNLSIPELSKLTESNITGQPFRKIKLAQNKAGKPASTPPSPQS